MSFCPNCGKELPDGTLFCDACGAALNGSGEAAPANPVEAPRPEYAAPAPEYAAPAPEYAAPTTPAPKKKAGFPKPAIIGIAAAAVVAVVVLLIVLLGGGSGARNNAFYVKDKEIYMNKGKDGAEVQITADYDSESGSDALISPNGKILVYQDKTAKGDSYYFKYVNKDEEGVKIDSDIDTCFINDSSRYLIYVKDGKLYRYDFNNQEKSGKQADDVGSVYVTKDGKKAICASDGKIISLTFDEDDKTTVAKDAKIVFVTEDLKTVYYLKKVDENGIGTFCKQKVGSEEEIVISKDVSYGTVYASGEAYLVKSEADDEDNTVSSLWYYDGKNEPVKLADTFDDFEARSQKSPALVYSVSEEIEGEEEKESETTYYLVVEGDKPTEIKADDAEDFNFTMDGKKVYFFANVDTDDDGNRTGDIMEMEVSSGSPEVYQKGVSSQLLIVAGDNVAYYDDYKYDSESYSGAGTLYINGEKVADDVYSVDFNRYDLETFIIRADKTDDGYTLYTYKKGDTVKVGEDVQRYNITADGTVYFLKDFDKGEGDLYVCKKGDPEKIDEEVTALIDILDCKAIIDLYGEYDMPLTLIH